MQEFFLHYLWQMQYFSKANLSTTDGEALEIFHPGLPNGHAGPDFSNARIAVGGMQWYGQVEIHTLSSEWYTHQHQSDPSYDNVVLHVVWKDDQPVVRKDHSRVPTLELRSRTDPALILRYRQLINSAFNIPCEKSLRDVDELIKTSMISRALMERLIRKTEVVMDLQGKSGGNWEETLYQMLFRNFGFKVNAEPFAQLARQLPSKIVRKHADKLHQVEALLFGQAGFLDSPKGDTYYKLLKREYALLSRKFNLAPSKMQKAQWKYLRLRPANFPTLRLAQLSALLHRHDQLFSRLLEAQDVKDLQVIFSVSPSPYWKAHYSFAAPSPEAIHDPGLASIENIMINTVIPLWVAYGKVMDDQSLIDRAIRLLEHLPPEENKITTTWRELGMKVQTAADSQGLIGLMNDYCKPRHCLRCTIGTSLIRPSS